VACGACRADLVDFTQIWRVDATPTIQGDESPGLAERVRAFLASVFSGRMGTQWALAVPAVAVLILGGFMWWIVASKQAPGADVAVAPRDITPMAPSAAAPAPSQEASPPSPQPPRTPPSLPQTNSNGVKARPPRTPPHNDDGITRSVEQAGPRDSSAKTRRVAGKSFIFFGGVWTDREYLQRDRSRSYESLTVTRGTDGFEKAAQRFAALSHYAALDGRVVVLEDASIVTIVGPAPR